MIIVYGDVVSVEVSVAHVTKLHLVNVLDALELTINAKSSMRVYLHELGSLAFLVGHTVRTLYQLRCLR